jgi:hypothetical protein
MVKFGLNGSDAGTPPCAYQAVKWLPYTGQGVKIPMPRRGQYSRAADSIFPFSFARWCSRNL